MFAPVERLISSPDVLSLVGSPARIYGAGMAPQGVLVPYVTWFTVTGDPYLCLDETPDSDMDQVQIDCYAGPDGDAERQVEQLAQAVRAALDAAMVANRVILHRREPDTKMYRIGLQADFIYSRE